MMTLLNVVQNEIRHAFDRLRVDTVARLNEKWMVGVKATDGHDGLRKVRSSHQDSPCLPGGLLPGCELAGPDCRADGRSATAASAQVGRLRVGTCLQ
ncbi:hypothetical protein G6F68_014077 [Rhizopus microsporus]|nr:hypothetical protein G6F68_014077 [Rhizopus microsporus]